MIHSVNSNPIRHIPSSRLADDRGPASGYRLSIQPNWASEIPIRFWDPSRCLIRSLRDYANGRKRGGALGRIQSKLAVIRHRFWSVVTGAEIPLNTWAIEGGLELPHPNGIVIHPDSQIGPNCRLFQQVTLGTGPRPGLPVLGANVDIGAGAKILGGVHLGDFSVIGANAVVITDIPAGAIAVGIPAKVKPDARALWDREVRNARGEDPFRRL